MGFFDKMFSGLTKTRKNIEDLEEVFRNYDIDSEDFYDELEEMLIMADVGGETTAQIMMVCRIYAGHARQYGHKAQA